MLVGLASTQSLQLLVLLGLASTQIFQLLVVVGLASTQAFYVVAPGTHGTEYVLQDDW